MKKIKSYLVPLLFGACYVTEAFAKAETENPRLQVNTEKECAASQKEKGSFMIRVRALGVFPESGGSITPIGGHAKPSNTAAPELDFTYFFTDNIATELILATTRHRVKAKDTSLGDVDVGKVSLLPPTLTVQYHVTQLEKILRLKPYLGMGINYPHFYNAKPGALNNVDYKDSFGPALQVGFDVPITQHLYFNFDVKKVWVRTKAKFNNGAIVAKPHLDPWLIGAGLGVRF